MDTNSRRQEGQHRRVLVEEGKYEEALASVDRTIQESPHDALLYRERGHLHLFFDHLQEARSDFDTTERLQASDFRVRPGRLHADGEYNAIGVTYWMEERRELAIAFWRYTTNLLLHGRVDYSHFGGGIEAGLLLWFGAVHERNETDIALVRGLFEKRIASTHWSHYMTPTSWPGRIAYFFLEKITEEDLLQGTNDAQHLCKAHFAMAIRARVARRYVAYKKHLELAAPRISEAELYDYYNVWPYFLARYEVMK
jgi:hypothetical protein